MSKNFLNYSSKAAEIRKDITELRDIVVSRRRDYMSAVGHYRELSLTYGMSDWERKQMDVEVDQAMKQCIRLIQTFQRQVADDGSLRAADEAPHFREIGHLLDKYLKKIAKIVSELRTVRYMKVQNMKKLSRLFLLLIVYFICSVKAVVSAVDKADSTIIHDNGSRVLNVSNVRRRFDTGKGLVAEGSEKKSFGKNEDSVIAREMPCSSSMVTETGGENLEVTDKELEQQMTAENEQLYARLIHTDDEIQKVEQQLSEIYKLQESFAEKVLEQEKDIEFVNQAAVTSVENIRDGNEQIREAIQNMASRRVILLFCLIALTFTLLFLDWYNA
ncbi:unnamed protein product [Enterobius vermicularis]|uniref:Syntaxin-18 n=1 Tax=Enterobius vermicularis TaxID=51028 RepID=A0A0N4VPB3_ENTVE|nr:unnamed protein product [Enterobius vermicularis]